MGASRSSPPGTIRTASPWFCSSYITHVASLLPLLRLPCSRVLAPYRLLLACSVSSLLVLGCCRRVRSRQDRVLRAGWRVLSSWRAGGVEVEVAEAAGAAVAGVVPPAKRRRVMGRRGGGGGRRPRRRVHAEVTFVQQLFQACRDVFKGPGTVPAPADADVLRAMLDRMRPEDVGLSSERRLFRTRDTDEETPTIYHTTIYNCENFSMEIFFLPPNAVIPLHNHPGMTVFNKLLLGSMHIESYDWVDPDPVVGSSSPDDRLRLAELVVDDVFTAPCDTSVLYPTTGGNMHRCWAIAPCAFLDILGPPYSLEEDRDCTYYADIPYSQHSMADCASDLVGVEEEGRRLAWLKEVGMPGELKIRSVPYRGPPISDTVTVQLSPAVPN